MARGQMSAMVGQRPWIEVKSQVSGSWSKARGYRSKVRAPKVGCQGS